MITSPFLASLIDSDDKESWKLQGACRDHDPELFFPRERNELAQEPAKRICRHCPVVTQCREWALQHEEELGIWGGMSEYERRRLQHRGRLRRQRLSKRSGYR